MAVAQRGILPECVTLTRDALGEYPPLRHRPQKGPPGAKPDGPKEARFYALGSCCVMQWMLPPPKTTCSVVLTPTTLKASSPQVSS